jgi:hypothetical protein
LFSFFNIKTHHKGSYRQKMGIMSGVSCQLGLQYLKRVNDPAYQHRIQTPPPSPSDEAIDASTLSSDGEGGGDINNSLIGRSGDTNGGIMSGLGEAYAVGDKHEEELAKETYIGEVRDGRHKKVASVSSLPLKGESEGTFHALKEAEGGPGVNSGGGGGGGVGRKNRPTTTTSYTTKSEYSNSPPTSSEPFSLDLFEDITAD